MLADLRGPQQAILEILVAEPSPMRLVEIARRLQLTPPSVHRQLRILVDSGIVETIRAPGDPSGRSPAYRARPFLHVVWVDPGQRILQEWSTNAPMRWDLPLVSRVPDEAAQRTLHTLLDRLGQASLIGRTPGEPAPRLSEAPSVPILVVYGSCAQGTAHSASDLDLAVLADWDPARVERLRNEVATVNLAAPRHIDIRVIPSGKNAPAVPQELADHLVRNGRWVYPNTIEPEALARRLRGAA